MALYQPEWSCRISNVCIFPTLLLPPSQLCYFAQNLIVLPSPQCFYSTIYARISPTHFVIHPQYMYVILTGITSPTVFLYHPNVHSSTMTMSHLQSSVAVDEAELCFSVVEECLEIPEAEGHASHDALRRVSRQKHLAGVVTQADQQEQFCLSEVLGLINVDLLKQTPFLSLFVAVVVFERAINAACSNFHGSHVSTYVTMI